MRTTLISGAIATLGLCAAAHGGELACPGSGTVVQHAKISETTGKFQGTLDPEDYFGYAIASLGDVNGDGVTDLAVGAQGDDDGGANAGAAWILFMNADGTVRDEQKVSNLSGNLGAVLTSGSNFGADVAALGDLDGDATPDLAVGASGAAAVWILFLQPDGTVKAKVTVSAPPFVTGLFGAAVASIGDLDGDGVIEMAVGSPFEGNGSGVLHFGAVRIHFLNSNGTVKAVQKITGAPGLPPLEAGDVFGSSVASPGDIDKDGVNDLAVGAMRDDRGGQQRGAVWVLRLNGDGTVKAGVKISHGAGGFQGQIDNFDFFGSALAPLGDLDGDGALDLATSALHDDDGGEDTGAVWILFLHGDGTVKAEQKISDTTGNFQGAVDDFDSFGFGLASLGDFDSDGLVELAVGAHRDDDGGFDAGAVWILTLAYGVVPPPCPADVVTDGAIGMDDLNAVLSEFGNQSMPSCPPDVDGDGVVDSDDLNAVLASFGSACPG